MNQANTNPSKSLYVSEDVISGIINNAVKEIDGVYDLAPAVNNLRKLMLKEKNAKDITIGMIDDVLSVSVGVVLENKAKAVAVSEKIQNKIKSSVQNMLGLTVAKVNVTVRSVVNLD